MLDSKQRPLQSLLCKGLELRGYFKVPSRSRKYIIYRRDAETFYFVGREGELRLGKDTKNSQRADDMFRYKLLIGIANHMTDKNSQKTS